MLVFGYLIGSIPFAIIISKTFYHKDIRDYGSKNSGGTNMGRVFGKKIGVITILLDMFKCVVVLVAAWAVIRFSSLNQMFIDRWGTPMWDNGVFYYYLAVLGASLGHCWPIYAGFKGGKTVSVFMGLACCTSWFELIVAAIAFFGVKAKTKYVSLASIVSAISISTFAWIMAILTYCLPESVPFEIHHIGMWAWGYFVLSGWEYASVMTIIGIILILRHIPNIKRLLRGEENKAGERKE